MEAQQPIPPAQTASAPAGCSISRTGEKTLLKDTGGNFIEVYLDRFNKRVKVLDHQIQDWQKAASLLDRTASEHHLGKILFNVKQSGHHQLENLGYVREGDIPSFFNGENALCYSRFTDSQRSESRYCEQEEAILNQIKNEQPGFKTKNPPAGLKTGRIDHKQVEELVSLYRKIFSTYPSPLLDPDYVHRVMTTHVCFWGVFKDDTVISAASAEMDLSNGNAEITDCATLPDYRGQGLLRHLIMILEEELRTRGIGALYSLARAGSYGMNAALNRLGYAYKGRFINNCHIGGRFEDMNLWTKVLDGFYPH